LGFYRLYSLHILYLLQLPLSLFILLSCLMYKFFFFEDNYFVDLYYIFLNKEYKSKVFFEFLSALQHVYLSVLFLIWFSKKIYITEVFCVLFFVITYFYLMDFLILMNKKILFDLSFFLDLFFKTFSCNTIVHMYLMYVVYEDFTKNIK
jgi:hypothetical protein